MCILYTENVTANLHIAFCRNFVEFNPCLHKFTSDFENIFGFQRRGCIRFRFNRNAVLRLARKI